jgi:hypothetical protein
MQLIPRTLIDITNMEGEQFSLTPVNIDGPKTIDVSIGNV